MKYTPKRVSRADNDTLVLEEELKLAITEVNVAYQPLEWRQHVVVRQDIPAYIRSFEVQSREVRAGVVMITNDTNKFPVATALAAREQYYLHNFGGAYRIVDGDLDELAQGRVPAFSPEREFIAAIARASEEKLDEVAAVGDPDLNLEGLLTLSGTTPSAGLGLTGDWDAATSDADFLEVLADIAKLADAIPDTTNERFQARKIILPTNVYRWLARTRFTDGSRTTLLQQLREDFPQLQIAQWRRANDVVLGGRVAVISDDPPWMAVPRYMEPGKVIQTHEGYERAFRSKFGGVFTTHAASVVYYDNPFAEV
jgi:hypothetical protein